MLEQDEDLDSEDMKLLQEKIDSTLTRALRKMDERRQAQVNSPEETEIKQFHRPSATQWPRNQNRRREPNDASFQNRQNYPRRSDMVAGNTHFTTPENRSRHRYSPNQRRRQDRLATVDQLEELKSMMETMMNQSMSRQADEPPAEVSVLNDPKTYFKTDNPYSREYLSTLPDEFATMPTFPPSQFSMPTKDKGWPNLTGEADYETWKAGFINNVYKYQIGIDIKVTCLRNSVDTRNRDIKRIVDNVKPDAYGFRQIVQRLHHAYGSKKAHKQSLYNRLMTANPVSMRNTESLTKFHEDLMTYVQNEYREDREGEIETEASHLYQSLCGKLASSAKENLLTYCRWSKKPHCTLTLVQWLTETVKSLRDTDYLQPKSANTTPVQQVQKKSVKLTLPNYLLKSEIQGQQKQQTLHQAKTP